MLNLLKAELLMQQLTNDGKQQNRGVGKTDIYRLP